MSNLPIPNFSGADFTRLHTAGQRDLPTIIAQSAQRTGVDFQYLIAQAQLESGMRADAKAGTSSATGLYQFIDQTWLGLVKDKGDQYGLGWAQNAISRNRDGHLSVADKSLKSSILALRNNPALSAALASEFARDNGEYLEQQTGRKPESVDLYLAHFLGPSGAAKFLNRMNSNPGGSAASVFPQAARANRNIFYDPSGAARSFETIRDRFESKLANAVNMVGGNGLPSGGNILPQRAGQGAEAPRMVQPADYLRIAQAHLNDKTGGLATGQKQSTISKPFNEPARAAYLMLATLGM